VSDDNQKLIRTFAVKTKELLSKLETVKSTNEDQLSMEILENMNLKGDMLRFLYNTALAENMVTA
jgi:hypothetical protein